MKKLWETAVIEELSKEEVIEKTKNMVKHDETTVQVCFHRVEENR